MTSSIQQPPSDDGTTLRLTDVSLIGPASLTRELEVIRTPGVTQSNFHAEGQQYSENDARLLQEILSGRWSRQYLYGSTPDWYRDSFYTIHRSWGD